MARPLRIEYPGAFYHIICRGNGKQNIYINDKDREEFLITLDDIVSRYNWLCYAYCLMSNHYHLLIETPDANLSIGMKQLNGIYAQNFNRKRNNVGHIFQGRFKAKLVQKENYLLRLCRYIILNPVRGGIIKFPEQWKWSSYLAMLGEVKAPKFLFMDWLREYFDSKSSFKKFILSAAEETEILDIRNKVFLGNKNFIQEIKNHLSELKESKENPRAQRFLNRLKLEEIFENVKDKKSRNEKICLAHIKHGYKLIEISDYISLHYSAVSKIFRKASQLNKKKSIKFKT